MQAGITFYFYFYFRETGQFGDWSEINSFLGIPFFSKWCGHFEDVVSRGSKIVDEAAGWGLVLAVV